MARSRPWHAAGLGTPGAKTRRGDTQLAQPWHKAGRDPQWAEGARLELRALRYSAALQAACSVLRLHVPSLPPPADFYDTL